MCEVIFRTLNKGQTPYHLLWLTMHDGPLRLQVNLPVVNTIIFTCLVTSLLSDSLKIKATDASKLDEIPDK